MEIKGTGRLSLPLSLTQAALPPLPVETTLPASPTKALTDRLSLEPAADDFAAVLDDADAEMPDGADDEGVVTFGGPSETEGLGGFVNRIMGMFAGERITQHFCNTCAAAVSMDEYARSNPKAYGKVRDPLAEAPHETTLPNGDEVRLHRDDKAAIDAHAASEGLSESEVRDMYLEAAVMRHYADDGWSAAGDLPPASGQGLTQRQADDVAEAFNGDTIRVPESRDPVKAERFLDRLGERLSSRGDQGVNMAVRSGGQEHMVHVVAHPDGSVSVNDAQGPYPAGSVNPRPQEDLVAMLPIGKAIDDIGGSRIRVAAAGGGELT